MKKILLLFSVLIAAACYSQQSTDTVSLRKEIHNTQSELQVINQQIRILKNERNSLRMQILDNYARQEMRDSLLNRKIIVLQALNNSLAKELELMRKTLSERNQAIRNEVIQTRQGGALFLIAVFSLLVIAFVYLVYRNHQLKLYLENEMLHTEMKIEDKHLKMRKKIKKKLGLFSSTIEKRLKKKYKLRKK